MVGKAPELAELERGVRQAVSFLKKASTEMRRIAAGDPDIAVELRHIARQLEAEANELARWNAA